MHFKQRCEARRMQGRTRERRSWAKTEHRWSVLACWRIRCSFVIQSRAKRHVQRSWFFFLRTDFFNFLFHLICSGSVPFDAGIWSGAAKYSRTNKIFASVLCAARSRSPTEAVSDGTTNMFRWKLWQLLSWAIFFFLPFSCRHASQCTSISASLQNECTSSQFIRFYNERRAHAWAQKTQMK